MKILSIASLLFVTSLVAGAAPRTWNFGDGSTFLLDLPEGARVEQVSPPEDKNNQAFTIRFPDEGASSTISYQFLVTRADTSTDWSTFEKIDAFLLKAGAESLQAAADKQMKPIHLSMKNGVGSYLYFTDPDLVGKEITRPKVFREMMMVACGVNGYTIFIRGYSNSTLADYFKRMNQIIESAVIRR